VEPWQTDAQTRGKVHMFRVPAAARSLVPETKMEAGGRSGQMRANRVNLSRPRRSKTSLE